MHHYQNIFTSYLKKKQQNCRVDHKEKCRATKSQTVRRCHNPTPAAAIAPLWTKIRSCPVSSALPGASTGVCGCGAQSDGAITTHHSSEWGEWQHPASPLYMAGPRARTQERYLDLSLYARNDSLRGWQQQQQKKNHILSACDPHRVLSYRGQSFHHKHGWMNGVARGGDCRGRRERKKKKKKEGCVRPGSGEVDL